MHTLLFLGLNRLAVVCPHNSVWSLSHQQEQSMFLEVNGLPRLTLHFGQEGELLVKQAFTSTWAVWVDGYHLPDPLENTLSETVWHPLSEDSAVIVDPSAQLVDIHTTGALARWLTYASSDLQELALEAKNNPFGPVANALVVWNDTAVSPTYLDAAGRAIYDRLVDATKYAYSPTAMVS